MDAITYSAARQNLAQTMNAVCENHSPVIITRQKSEPVVMMSLADFNSIQETAIFWGIPPMLPIFGNRFRRWNAANWYRVRWMSYEKPVYP